MIFVILDTIEIIKEKNQNYQYDQEDKKLKSSNFGKLVSPKNTISSTLQNLREEQSQTGEKVKNLENHLMNLQIERDNVISS